MGKESATTIAQVVPKCQNESPEAEQWSNTSTGASTLKKTFNKLLVPLSITEGQV